jgi:hypothetical protein
MKVLPCAFEIFVEFSRILARPANSAKSCDFGYADFLSVTDSLTGSPHKIFW